MNFQEVVESFKNKYVANKPCIWDVRPDENRSVISVFTDNAKVWVDLPEHHHGVKIKMIVSQKPDATVPKKA